MINGGHQDKGVFPPLLYMCADSFSIGVNDTLPVPKVIICKFYDKAYLMGGGGSCTKLNFVRLTIHTFYNLLNCLLYIWYVNTAIQEIRKIPNCEKLSGPKRFA